MNWKRCESAGTVRTRKYIYVNDLEKHSTISHFVQSKHDFTPKPRLHFHSASSNFIIRRCYFIILSLTSTLLIFSFAFFINSVCFFFLVCCCYFIGRKKIHFEMDINSISYKKYSELIFSMQARWIALKCRQIKCTIWKCWEQHN